MSGLKASPATKPAIKYFGNHQRGPVVSIRDDSDNPLSENFIPLQDRSEYDKARWWALYSKKKNLNNPNIY